MRAWLKRLALAAVLLGVALVAAVIGLIGPYVRDDLRLDGAVRAVALDWRDFGEEKARTRLQYELDHQRIGMQVGDDDCRFDEREGSRIVRCDWSVEVEVPGVAWRWPLSFASVATVTPDGDLR